VYVNGALQIFIIIFIIIIKNQRLVDNVKSQKDVLRQLRVNVPIRKKQLIIGYPHNSRIHELVKSRTCTALNKSANRDSMILSAGYEGN